MSVARTVTMKLLTVSKSIGCRIRNSLPTMSTSTDRGLTPTTDHVTTSPGFGSTAERMPIAVPAGAPAAAVRPTIAGCEKCARPVLSS